MKEHTSEDQLHQRFEFGLERSECVTTAAASVGRVDLLEIITGDYGCPLGLSTYCGAARRGQSGALRYESLAKRIPLKNVIKMLRMTFLAQLVLYLDSPTFLLRQLN